MQVVEQASKHGGKIIETKFSDGSYCWMNKGGDFGAYGKSGTRLSPSRSAKLIAKMKDLAAKGLC